MIELQQLSIVVPTFNRHAYAKRQIEYWRDYPVTLFILDGTEQPMDSDYLHALSDNIKYYHLPVSFSERLEHVVKLIDTPYTALLADDEFFLPSALIACSKELEANNELVSCMGQAVQFFYGPKNIILGQPIYQRLLNYEVSQDSAIERMSYHMEPYICSAIYSVMRSDSWLTNIRLVASGQYSCPIVSELQFELLTCVQGKSKVINHLMWLRSSENPPVSIKGWNRDVDFLSWYDKGQFERERKQFAADFIAYCGKISNESISQEDINCALSEFNAFLQQRTNRRGGYKLKQIAVAIIKTLLNRSAPSLLRIYRSQLYKFKYYLHRVDELEIFLGKYADEYAVKVDFDGVADIVKRIRQFRKINDV